MFAWKVPPPWLHGSQNRDNRYVTSIFHSVLWQCELGNIKGLQTLLQLSQKMSSSHPTSSIKTSKETQNRWRKPQKIIHIGQNPAAFKPALSIPVTNNHQIQKRKFKLVRCSKSSPICGYDRNIAWRLVHFITTQSILPIFASTSRLPGTPWSRLILGRCRRTAIVVYTVVYHGLERSSAGRLVVIAQKCLANIDHHAGGI